MKGRAGFAALALACAAEASVSVRAQPAKAMHNTSLTVGAPPRDVAVAAQSVAPTQVAIAITAIDNPSAQAFSVAAALSWVGARASEGPIALGIVTPYPANRAGTFQLAVPKPAGALLLHKDGKLSVRLTLQPIAADRPLVAPLTVTIGDLTWQ